MRTPYRKPGKYSQMSPDPIMTEDKFQELKNKLERIKKAQPQAAAEVSRLAELGDFSENAEYQHAKGRLRGMNDAIFNLEKQLNQAVVIKSQKQISTVQVGHKVTVEINNKQKIYRILGSSETNPEKGVISYNSPMGAALIGHRAGDVVKIKLADKEVEYKIKKIE